MRLTRNVCVYIFELIMNIQYVAETSVNDNVKMNKGEISLKCYCMQFD